jgi:hypothetical protein
VSSGVELQPAHWIRSLRFLIAVSMSESVLRGTFSERLSLHSHCSLSFSHFSVCLFNAFSFLVAGKYETI